MRGDARLEGDAARVVQRVQWAQPVLLVLLVRETQPVTGQAPVLAQELKHTLHQENALVAAQDPQQAPQMECTRQVEAQTQLELQAQ